jgi:cell division inhibitor SepF
MGGISMSSGLIARALDFLGLPSQPPYDDPYGDPGYADEAGRERDSGVIPLRAERSEFAGVTIIRAEPSDMEEAAAVADEIKHRLPVVLNLQAVPEHEATRIRDFLGGVTYGLNGYMRRIAEWVYICSPFDMPVEKLVLSGTNMGSRDRDGILEVAEDF